VLGCEEKVRREKKVREFEKRVRWEKYSRFDVLIDKRENREKKKKKRCV
jgi:hypothetical protein